MKKNWIIRHELPIGSDQADSISESEIVKTILDSRGVTDVESFLYPAKVDQDFLKSTQKLFGDEFEKARQLIDLTMLNNKPIVVHGDYDVDGVSATAILWESIYYGLDYKNIYPFIPHREIHGYGLSQESIDDILLEHPDIADGGLLITVDCGITSKDAVDYAHHLGVRVIISDHHTRPEKDESLPQAEAILHTHDLCGAGIAWVLARSLQEEIDPATGTELVALATIADVQELVGLNRSLVIEGLQRLTNTSRVGLQVLYELVGISGKPIGTYEVGWMIGPRINASGRLEHALDALRLLVARNRPQAVEIANNLDQLNLRRQQMTQAAVESAIRLVEQEWSGEGPILVSRPDWHEGIIGLIAGKLVQKYNVPAMVMSENTEFAKGSARSVEGVNITDLLKEFEHLMESVGGHEMAAGFSVRLENLAKLKHEIGGLKLSDRLDVNKSPELKIDLELPMSLIGWDLYQELNKLEPFGVGNSRPVFATSDLVVSDIRTVGKSSDHLKLQFSGNINAIGFGLGDMVNQVKVGNQVNVAYTIDKDDYRGGNNIQLKVKDFEV